MKYTMLQENRASVSRRGRQQQGYSPPQQHSIWKSVHSSESFGAKRRSCHLSEEVHLSRFCVGHHRRYTISILTALSADSCPYCRFCLVRNKDTTKDPTMKNTEIYALVTWSGSVLTGAVGITVGTARKLTSTANITVD